MFAISGVGLIHIVKDGVTSPEPFLDLQTIISPGRGLYSMAFHPDFATNGRFFVVYQAGDLSTSLVEYSVGSDPDVADPDSGTTLLGPMSQTSTQHSWDQLQFGSDGMLYLSTGDGVDPGVPSNVSQDLGSLSGKILRLDIDLPPPYIPADNPFVGMSGARPEILHFGLRQPWRFSFDRDTGDMFVADVGFATREEINVLPAGTAGGQNFGWRCLEGSLCGNLAECFPTCGTSDWIQPIHEYEHGTGLCAVIGGFMYRGDAIPSLAGRYLFADYCGGLSSFAFDGTTATDIQDHSQQWLAPDGAPVPLVSSFGQDNAGELYVVSLLGNTYKLAPPDPISNYCETSANSATSGALISASGTPSVDQNAFVLQVSDAPPSSFALLFYGSEQEFVPLGDGVRCIANPLFRLLPAIPFTSNGDLSFAFDVTSPPNAAGTITAGSTWNFQCWYRDPTGPGASGFNFSDALQVIFQP